MADLLGRWREATMGKILLGRRSRSGTRCAGEAPRKPKCPKHLAAVLSRLILDLHCLIIFITIEFF